MKLNWNGNEIVLQDDATKGVAGIADDMPESFAVELVRRWNFIEYLKEETKQIFDNKEE